LYLFNGQQGSKWLDQSTDDLQTCVGDVQNDICLGVEQSIVRMIDRLDEDDPDTIQDAVDSFVDESTEVTKTRFTIFSSQNPWRSHALFISLPTLPCLFLSILCYFYFSWLKSWCVLFWVCTHMIQVLEDSANLLQNGQNDFKASVTTFATAGSQQLNVCIDQLHELAAKSMEQVGNRFRQSSQRLRDELEKKAKMIRDALFTIYKAEFATKIKNEGLSIRSQQAQDRWFELIKEPSIQEQLRLLQATFQKHCQDHILTQIDAFPTQSLIDFNK
jgi:flagellar basal body-associated protein FliL